MVQLLAPGQQNYGVHSDAEAAVHATRCFLNNISIDQAMVKLDFSNAFNSTWRYRMLEAVQSLCLAIYTFVYAAASNLQWDDQSILSAEGVQQGDPLGPLFFCLTLHHHSLQLRSEFKIHYLDDVSLGADCQDLLHGLKVMSDAAELGLTLNTAKCKIISHDMNI